MTITSCEHTVKLLAFLFLSVSSVFSYAGAFEQLFAPKPELIEVWLVHNPDSSQVILHNDWDAFLKINIKPDGQGVNRIAYAAVTESDKNLLNNYITAMQRKKISQFNRNEQLAYWINIYNAVTVKVVLDHYPVSSIRDIDISPGFFSDGPWGKKLMTVENRELSLNDVEHGILRPIWKDPRIHYAVNCASIGCPNLAQTAYISKNINTQLDDAAKKFVTHPRAVRMTEEGVVVSSIYSWFQQDFGERESDVISHIQLYATPEISSQINGIKFFANDEYDWSLNDALEKTH